MKVPRWLPRPDRRSFWQDNLLVKIFALFLAILLWLSLVSRGNVQKELTNIPWQIRNLPAGLEVVDRSADMVSVRVSGLATTLQHLSPDDLVLNLELPRGAGPGTHTIYLSERDVPVGRGVSVIRITPPQVTLELERRLEREILVHPEFRGTPAPGFRFVRHSIQPAAVTLTGPESQIMRVHRVETVPISLAGARRTQTGTVSLLLPELAGDEPAENQGSQRPNLMRFKSLAEVEYTAEITEIQGFRVLTVPIAPLPPEEALEFEPEAAMVVLAGPERELARLDPGDVQLRVRLESVPAGESVLVVPEVVRSPAGVLVREVLTEVRVQSLPAASPTPTAAAGQSRERRET